MFLLVGAGLFAMFLFLTYYFQINLGYSPLKAGFAFLPFSVGIILLPASWRSCCRGSGPKPLHGRRPRCWPSSGMLLLTQIDADTSYWTHVLPAEILMSVGLAGVFIPASSTALVGVGHHDAGVASAVLNTSQQIGGSLGTALLNTLFAGAVTGYLAANVRSPAGRRAAGAGGVHRRLPRGVLLGRHAVRRGAGGGVVLINARKEDVPTEPGGPSA